MKLWKRICSLVLTLGLAVSLLPAAAFAEEAKEETSAVTGYAVPLEEGEAQTTYTTEAPTQQQAYDRIIAMKEKYPEGMRWTNDNYYEWKGGIFAGGYGCAGFAFLLSDAAFGDLPVRMTETFTYSQLKVGDILRINNDSHSVIILKISSTQVTIAEGNYNSSIHWGRTLSKEKVMQSDYVMTRYPCDHTYTTKRYEPTCCSAGYTLYTCTKCGYSYQDDYDYTIQPHTWDSGTVVTPPTETEEGTMEYRCTVCGAYSYETIPVLDPDFPFYDVPKDAWYRTAAEYVYHNGLMVGDNHCFRPSGKVTRAMVAQILYANEGKPAVSGKSPFTDVQDSGAWYYEAVVWASQNGVVSGYTNNTFRPMANITREQFAVILYAHAGKPEASASLDGYADAAKVSGWARNAMMWAVQNGIISGTPEGKLNPGGHATRAEAAVMLMKYLSK